VTRKAAAAGAGLTAAIVGALLAARLYESGRAAVPPHYAASLIPEKCESVNVSDARCYRLTVRENRAISNGRTIPLRIVVLPATGRDRAADPIFLLAGGPGQAATEMLRDPSLVEGALRQQRDLVFADQRGTGGSHALLCRFYGPPEDAQSYFQAFLPVEKVRACRTELEKAADLSQYTTAASVADLEEIRAALGAPQINLIGGSYGTRLAMEYVRRHEDRVRSVILDSAVPPDTHVPEDFGRFFEHALNGLMDECTASPSCASEFPAIRDEAKTVFERLRSGPVTATVVHPYTRQQSRVTVTRDHVGEAIRYMTYSSREAARVPLYLHLAYNGDYSPIAQFLIRWRADGMFEALYLSITCAEDVPYVAPDSAERDDPTYLGGYRIRQQRAACAEWPRGVVSADHGQPVKARIPVLITSGLLDPVTPAANGDEIAQTLSNSLHVRVPFSGHSPAGLSGLQCLSELKRTFIEHARTDNLDVTCVSRISRPGFATSR
jgi:pimeloyl-ACP methyl ester carboxylesterase